MGWAKPGDLDKKLGKKNRHSPEGLPIRCVFPVDDSVNVESSLVSIQAVEMPRSLVTAGSEIDHTQVAGL
jgi:hypothetical protein